MTIKEKLSGVFVPAITPFINDEIRYDKLEYNLKKLNETDIKGYLALGSNGENKSLTYTEKLKVLEIFIKNKGNKIIMAGTGCESTRETISFSKEAAKIGADFVSVLTPSYFAKQIKDEILIDYYTEIADNVDIPVLIYNAPGFTGGVKVSPKVISKLANHPNIVGMKDSSTDGIMSFLSASKGIDNFHVIAGSANFFLTGLICGATGGILSLANAFPNICCELYNFFIEGKIKEATDLHFKIFKLNSKVSGSGGVSAVKVAATLAGFFGGEPRRPLKPLNDVQIGEMREYLKGEGII
ncbi:MAG: dihydrodipicolinate synthase family protein [Actinobacteria bacterium]|nr:dihydrodipicolinate synthase family protein [Cyanobacteriota bacterium]MCL5771000.1 dihydrodipicolinate synthase family protein [Actinomycetota bacterium]